MADIQDGYVYKNIVHSLENERQSQFISLTCNIDGAAVYTSNEQSMWTFTACVNELKRTKRFSIENIIGKSLSKLTLFNISLCFSASNQCRP